MTRTSLSSPSWLLIFFGIILFASCKKEDKPGGKSRKDLLTAAPWKFQAFTINPALDYDGDGDDETDLYAIEEPCGRDDQMIFRPNGEFAFDEGPTKCEPSDPQTETVGTWEFRNDEKEIFLSGSGDNNLIQIVDLTESRLKVKWTESEDGVTYTFEQTFNH